MILHILLSLALANTGNYHFVQHHKILAASQASARPTGREKHD